MASSRRSMAASFEKTLPMWSPRVAHLGTGVLDGAKIADGAGFRRRSLLVVLPLAAGVAFIAAAAIQLYLPYIHGANLMYGYTYRSNPLLGFRDFAA